MFKKFVGIFFLCSIFQVASFSQTTNGLITGSITDGTGAVVAGAQVEVTNQGTGVSRSTVSDGSGYYVVPQLAPGVYSISVKMQGFATETRTNVELQVNQSITLGFALPVSSATQTVQVTGAPPQLNTTSATLSAVIGHDSIVDLPLNGRQFTQLTLLTPGAAPKQASQQTANLVPLGAGGIVPTVDGQRPRQNNFTMDGVLNNYVFANTWALSPPPDALQEFNVQSHITDAQFAISTGANINVVSRSGTNAFHGSLWEFLRNDALDAQTFPETARVPYRQNQYGVYFGGPVRLPHFNGTDNTWFSAYWEGFRSTQSVTTLGNTLTPAMIAGDFSALATKIYDPATSQISNGVVTRTQFPGNVIPAGRLNPAAVLLAQKFFPAPNLNVSASTLPNYIFDGDTITDSDQTGIRIDRNISSKDILFGRFNRSNINALRPGALPSQPVTASEYGRGVAVGYTHLFSPSAILNVRYGYLNTYLGRGNTPVGADFVSALGMAAANPPHDGLSFGPNVSLSNGFSGIAQTIVKNGPQTNNDAHGDMSWVRGGHTIGLGGMYYHLHAFSDGWQYTTAFTQNATSINGAAGATGLGPASFMLGTPNSLAAILGNSAGDQSINWYGMYVQDQWQATKKLAITAGIRWDLVTPANFHKIVSSLNPLNGQFLVTGAVPPSYPSATASSGLYNAQYNGFEPRFGVTYAAMQRTVVHAAVALLDDHNNNLVQQNQDVRVTWPSAVQTSVTLLNQGLAGSAPVYLNQLPAASSYLSGLPQYVGYGVNPNNRIPYSIEYNTGVEQQLTRSVALDLNYVGSVSRHLFIIPTANTAPNPGPGSLASRGQPFPQYGTFSFDWNQGHANYNALQAELKKTLSSGLYFSAAYTWSKSFDVSSDAYSGTIQNFYNINADWAPSDFNLGQMFVFSGMYSLPWGRGRTYMGNANRFFQMAAGGWNAGGIISMTSGSPFNAEAGADVANVGGSATAERAEKIGPAFSGTGFRQSPSAWMNKASFAAPAVYTFGNESRNDIVGPTYKDVDITASKNFSITEHMTFQFRGDFFNAFNHTNYSNPTVNVQSASFGRILTAAGPGREIQFGAKVVF